MTRKEVASEFKAITEHHDEEVPLNEPLWMTCALLH
jgi:hypothetical protein